MLPVSPGLRVLWHLVFASRHCTSVFQSLTFKYSSFSFTQATHRKKYRLLRRKEYSSASNYSHVLCDSPVDLRFLTTPAILLVRLRSVLHILVFFSDTYFVEEAEFLWFCAFFRQSASLRSCPVLPVVYRSSRLCVTCKACLQSFFFFSRAGPKTASRENNLLLMRISHWQLRWRPIREPSLTRFDVRSAGTGGVILTCWSLGSSSKTVRAPRSRESLNLLQREVEVTLNLCPEPRASPAASVPGWRSQSRSPGWARCVYFCCLLGGNLLLFRWCLFLYREKKKKNRKKYQVLNCPGKTMFSHGKCRSLSQLLQPFSKRPLRETELPSCWVSPGSLDPQSPVLF